MEIKMPMMTTLNEIRKYAPCQDGWKKLLKGLDKTQPDDEPLLFSEILRINGLDDALWCLHNTIWCLRSAPKEYDNKIRLFAISIARHVQHLMQDHRSIDALDVAERYAKGKANKKELKSAWSASKAAVEEEWSAHKAAPEAESPAAWSARGASWTAWSASKAAVWSASRSAADSAAWAASKAAKKSAAWKASYDKERRWQEEQFLKMVNGE
jgi:hypothetical protein